MNTKKLKNRGFSLFISLVGSMILMGVAVSIITSINSSLDQTNSIEKINQLFFASESGKEAAFFHHNVRGAGLTMPEANNKIQHDDIKAIVKWGIDGRVKETGSVTTLKGEVHENEKITIPLYWDSSTAINEDESIVNMNNISRPRLELKFPDNDTSFDFGNNDSSHDKDVLFMWSVSRKNAGGLIQTFIPSPDSSGNLCGVGRFYCKHNFSSSDVISFNSTVKGKILPNNTTDKNLNEFMSDATATNYEISFQPILPFTDSNGDKISSIKFELTGGNVGEIPRNNYTINSKVDFGDFEKEITTTVKEKPSIGAFDYLIFK